jgi:biotin carboxylase
VKRLFIVGASGLQLPAILKAREMGLMVAVADYNPYAAGIPYADEYYAVSTIDEEGVYAAARDFKADGILTLATDMPMRAVAYAAERLGLSGIRYETAVKATDKGDMIRAFDAAKVAHPWYFVVDSPGQLGAVMERLAYPCVSKPTDNAGSRGVVLIHSREDVEACVAYSASQGRRGSVILEEYMRGEEVSVEAVVIEGDVRVVQVTDKLTTGEPHFVEMGHSQPSRLHPADVEAIKDLAARAVRAVGIESGAAHVEVMLTADGPRMIELGARMGGDCIATHLVPLSTGVDMVGAAILIALGETPDVAPSLNRGSAIRYFSSGPGRVERIAGVEDARNLEGVREVVFTLRPGDFAREITSSADRVGFVVAEADTAERAVEICNEAISRVEIQTRDHPD